MQVFFLITVRQSCFLVFNSRRWAGTTAKTSGAKTRVFVYNERDFPMQTSFFCRHLRVRKKQNCSCQDKGKFVVTLWSCGDAIDVFFSQRQRRKVAPACGVRSPLPPGLREKEEKQQRLLQSRADKENKGKAGCDPPSEIVPRRSSKHCSRPSPFVPPPLPARIINAALKQEDLENKAQRSKENPGRNQNEARFSLCRCALLALQKKENKITPNHVERSVPATVCDILVVIRGTWTTSNQCGKLTSLNASSGYLLFQGTLGVGPSEQRYETLSKGPPLLFFRR